MYPLVLRLGFTWEETVKHNENWFNSPARLLSPPSFSPYTTLSRLAIVHRLLPQSHKMVAAAPDGTAHLPRTELKHCTGRDGTGTGLPCMTSTFDRQKNLASEDFWGECLRVSCDTFYHQQQARKNKASFAMTDSN